MTEIAVLPTYLVLDESSSMVARIADLQSQLADLLDYLASEPAVAATVRLCIIGFSGDARVVVPLSDPREMLSIPSLKVGGSTSFTAAFILLTRTISQDILKLRNIRQRILRPTIFFLTDGQPNDEDWITPLETLKALPAHIIAFGFGDAPMQVLEKIGSTPDLVYRANNKSDVFGPFFSSLTESIVRTSMKVREGRPRIELTLPNSEIAFNEEDSAE